MVAQNKPVLFVSLSGLDWRARLCRIIDQDGDGNGHLLAWEGALAGDNTINQADFDAVLAKKTFDDLFYFAATLNGGNPGLACLKTAHCGRTAATMGRLRDLLPNSFSRTVNTINAAGGGAMTLAINTVHVLVLAATLAGYQFTLLNGAAAGDQIDFCTEGSTAALNFTIKDFAGNTLRTYDLEAGGSPIYFTAIWNGANWVVAQG